MRRSLYSSIFDPSGSWRMRSVIFVPLFSGWARDVDLRRGRGVLILPHFLVKAKGLFTNILLGTSRWAFSVKRSNSILSVVSTIPLTLIMSEVNSLLSVMIRETKFLLHLSWIIIYWSRVNWRETRTIVNMSFLSLFIKFVKPVFLLHELHILLLSRLFYCIIRALGASLIFDGRKRGQMILHDLFDVNQIWMVERDINILILKNIVSSLQQPVSNLQLFFKFCHDNLSGFKVHLSSSCLNFFVHVCEDWDVLFHLKFKHFDGRGKDSFSLPYFSELVSSH